MAHGGIPLSQLICVANMKWNPDPRCDLNTQPSELRLNALLLLHKGPRCCPGYLRRPSSRWYFSVGNNGTCRSSCSNHKTRTHTGACFFFPTLPPTGFLQGTSLCVVFDRNRQSTLAQRHRYRGEESYCLSLCHKCVRVWVLVTQTTTASVSPHLPHSVTGGDIWSVSGGGMSVIQYMDGEIKWL